MKPLGLNILFLILSLGASAHAGFGGGAVKKALPDDALIDEGSRALEGGDAKRALELFQHAAEKAPKDPRAHYLAGAAHQQLGDRGAAERAFKAALALDPSLVEVRGELGIVYLDTRRYADAARELSEAVKRQPDFWNGWYNLGQAELAQKKCPEALAAYAKVTELDAKSPDGWINRSVAERRCQKIEPAQASAAQAVKLAPKDGAAHLNLGLVLSEANKLDDAAAELTVATKLTPQSHIAWWSLGLTELKRKHHKEAVAALEKAHSLHPNKAIAQDLERAKADGKSPRSTPK